MSDKLLPCPFCGTDAGYKKVDGEMLAFCPDHSCPNDLQMWEPAWNRRPPSDAVRALEKAEPILEYWMNNGIRQEGLDVRDTRNALLAVRAALSDGERPCEACKYVCPGDNCGHCGATNPSASAAPDREAM